MKYLSCMPLLILLLLACGSCSKQPQKSSVTLKFYPFVGQQPLVFNEYLYANPGGPGQFKIRDFQLYISNLVLHGDSDNYIVPNSYHLLRFDNETGVYELVVELPKPLPLQGLTLGIGVDAKANGTVQHVGDLDPNSRMAWSWDVGYKFVLFEGALQQQGNNQPLVYHVGFDENYQSVSIDFVAPKKQNSENIKNFKLDILALFLAAEPLDLANTPAVKFDKNDAANIAAGFSQLISYCTKSCR